MRALSVAMPLSARPSAWPSCSWRTSAADSRVCPSRSSVRTCAASASNCESSSTSVGDGDFERGGDLGRGFGLGGASTCTTSRSNPPPRRRTAGASSERHDSAAGAAGVEAERRSEATLVAASPLREPDELGLRVSRPEKKAFGGVPRAIAFRSANVTP